VSGVGNLDVSSDGEHGKSTTDGTDEELKRGKKSQYGKARRKGGKTHDAATTVTVDDEEAPDESKEGFDHTEDTGREEGGRGSGDTDRLEDGRRVVVDSVDSWCVLEGKQRCSGKGGGKEDEPVPFCHMKSEVVMSMRRKRKPLPKSWRKGAKKPVPTAVRSCSTWTSISFTSLMM
jgi:hypothetical protein